MSWTLFFRYREYSLFTYLVLFATPFLGGYSIHLAKSMMFAKSTNLLREFDIALFILSGLITPFCHSLKHVSSQRRHIESEEPAAKEAFERRLEALEAKLKLVQLAVEAMEKKANFGPAILPGVFFDIPGRVVRITSNTLCRLSDFIWK